MLVTIKKCEFHIIKTKFYGFIMELKKLSIDLKKIKAMLKWQKLNNIVVVWFGPLDLTSRLSVALGEFRPSMVI